MSFTEDLRTLVRARYPVIWVQTHEEERVLRYVLEVATHPKGTESAPAKPLFLWSQTKGLEEVRSDGTRSVVDAELTGDASMAMQRVIQECEQEEGRIFILRDVHRFFGDGPEKVAYRFLRDAAHALRSSHSTLVITSPVSNLPIEVEKDVVVLDLPLPTSEELRVRLEEVLEGLDSKVERPKNGQVERILKAGLGLSEDEFAGAVKESCIRAHKVDPHIIVKQKEQVIRKSGVVELFSSVEGLESVGGLDLLRERVEEVAIAFTDKAAKFGARPDKGMFLTGPPGTGKTLMAKAAANHLGFPLLWLKGDAVFSKFVGESEQNMKRVQQLADAVAPCILFIDECEKLIAGATGGSETGDSGVAKRVFGSLLTYMQEHTTPVLVIATANNPLAIPPEMMGRFDSIFFVDMPQPQERADIFVIHLNKVRKNPKDYDMRALVEASEGFSGREIERVIDKALKAALKQDPDHPKLTTQHLLSALRRVQPLSKTRKVEVEEMRSWAKVNAEPASSTAVAHARAAAKPEV
jgi:ATP-dependent 26S proteasome regulatory subunit